MLKIINKVMILTLVLIMVLSANITHVSMADGTNPAKALIGTLDAGEDSAADTKVQNVVNVIITVARVIGVAVAIVMLLVLAMKYMTAAPGEKADIKKSAVVYVVGAVVLFAVTGILGLINTFSSKISA